MKKTAILLAAAVVLLLFSSCMPLLQKHEIGLDQLSILRASDGDLYISASSEELAAAGVTVGDSVDVRLTRKYSITDVPYYSGEYAEEGQSCLLPDEETGGLKLDVPETTDIWTEAQLTEKKRVTVALNEKEKYLDVEQAQSFYYDLIQQLDTGGFAPCSYEEKQSMHYVITEFTPKKGLLDAQGKLDFQSGGSHSELIPAAAGTKCYVGFRDGNASVVGAFYSAVGDWLAPLTADDVYRYDYFCPNGIDGTWRYEDEDRSTLYSYLRLYAFDVPENAAYVSLNLTSRPEYAYRQFLATMPVYALSNTGNLIWRDAEPCYQALRHKKLCFIGQSNIMIDRCLRKTDPDSDCPYRYIAGFQEYLIPWFGTVDSYGYSGKGYMKNGATGIYDYVISAGLDLSGYDTYIFTPGGNALTLKNMGAYDSTDVTTYFGAMNALVDYVRAQHSEKDAPTIYITNMIAKRSMEADPAYAERTIRLNEELLQFAAHRNCILLDSANETGLSWETLSEWSYDGVHSNQIGNRTIGLFYRKKLVGF